MSLLAAVDRFNSTHPWSHNDLYLRFVPRHARLCARSGGTVGADVGCGAGTLLVRLADVFPTVVGIEPSPGVAAIARQRCSSVHAVRVECRRFGGEHPHSYDFISFVASMHHTPLEAALREVQSALRPRGRLVVVGIAKESRRDAVRSAISLILNPVIGLLRQRHGAARTSTDTPPPTAESAESFEEIRSCRQPNPPRHPHATPVVLAVLGHMDRPRQFGRMNARALTQESR